MDTSDVLAGILIFIISYLILCYCVDKLIDSFPEDFFD